MEHLSSDDREWVETCVKTVLKSSPSDDLKEGYDVSVILALHIFSYAAKRLSFTEQDSPSKRTLEIMRYAQTLWEYLCEFIETTDKNVVCQRIGFLSAMIITSQNNTQQWLKDAIRDAATQIIKERGSSLLNDPVPFYPTMEQDVVDRLIEQCDPNWVLEFFELFKELKVFYADPSKYDDPADVERHQKLMAIFNKMIRVSGDAK